MELDFHDRPVENELDRMFDYDADGVLSPLEQSYKLDFITGDIEEDSDDYESDFDADDDDDDDDDGAYYISPAALRREDDYVKRMKAENERRKSRQMMIIFGILFVSSMVFANSPGIVLFIAAMLFSAKISRIF